MFTLILAIVTGAAGCLLLTPLLRWGLLRLKAGERRSRPGAGPIPRLGGLAVLAAAGLGTVAPYWLHTDVARQLRPETALVPRLLPAVLLILALGIVDDLFDVSPQVKLLVQSLAALVAFANGVQVSGLFGHELPVWAALVLTVVWLAGCTNAFNLLDGLDGLTAGIALFATITVLIHALLNGNLDLALLTAAMTGALGAFLGFNFFPASIYLGDAGSLSIGFLLGCFALLWMDKSTTVLGMTAPLLAMVVPLFDTTLSVARRWLAHRPILEGDQSHVHHRLVQLGLTPRGAVLVLYGVAAAGALVGLILANLRQEHVEGLVILAFVAVAGLGIYWLDFHEFAEASRVWRTGLSGYRRSVHCRIEAARLLAAMEGAEDGNAIWNLLSRLSELLSLQMGELRIGPEASPLWQRRRPTDHGVYAQGWHLQILLGDDGELGLVRLWGSRQTATAIPLPELAAEVNSLVSARIRTLWPQAVSSRVAAAQG